MTTSQKQKGFTLMELMVVVAITAILASMAAPSFVGYINTTRQSSAATRLLSDLNRARSEAIKRNSRVLLCVRNTAGTDCGTGTNWQNGWLTCYDLDRNGACDTPPADGSNPNPIMISQALHTTLTLTASASTIQFNPNATQGTTGAATFTLSGTWTGATSKMLSVSTTGNISRY